MTIQKRLELSQKIMTIALNEALRGWHPPVEGQLYCPLCQSAEIYQRMRRKNGMTHGCRTCQQEFSEEMVQQCRCTRPGRLAKCQFCPQYEHIRKLMKFNIDQLRGLSNAEADRIMAHPNFYHKNFSLQQFLPHIKLKHYANRETASGATAEVPAEFVSTDKLQQLSLFD